MDQQVTWPCPYLPVIGRLSVTWPCLTKWWRPSLVGQRTTSPTEGTFILFFLFNFNFLEIVYFVVIKRAIRTIWKTFEESSQQEGERGEGRGNYFHFALLQAAKNSLQITSKYLALEIPFSFKISVFQIFLAIFKLIQLTWFDKIFKCHLFWLI